MVIQIDKVYDLPERFIANLTSKVNDKRLSNLGTCSLPKEGLKVGRLVSDDALVSCDLK